jgi:membrane-associated phospholipid phosphatase
MRSTGALEAARGLPDALAGPTALASTLGDPLVVLVALLAGYWLGERDRWATVLGGALAALGVVLALKAVLALPRPSGPPPLSPGEGPLGALYGRASATDGYGFPSGHATAATVVWGGLAATLARPSRRVRVALAATAVAAVAAARVVLGVHYLGDVLAGVALGTTCLLGGRALLARSPRPEAETALAVGAALSLVPLVVSVTPTTVAVAAGGVGVSAGHLLATRGDDRPGVEAGRRSVGVASRPARDLARGRPAVAGGALAVVLALVVVESWLSTATPGLGALVVLVGGAGLAATASRELVAREVE